MVYPTYEDFLLAASESLGAELDTVRHLASRPLAESALAAPAAGFGDHEQYPDFPVKAAVLLQRLVSNHPLADGNKRTALLCTVLFANLNFFEWDPPDDELETAEVVEAAAAGTLPQGALRAWIEERLRHAEPLSGERPKLVMYPAEYIGSLPYEGHSIPLSDGLTITDVHGFNPAAVYVRRISGKTEGISIAEIIISVVGDGYAQEELDAENAEAQRYPLGPKEYWRGRLVGTAVVDDHPMTDEEFEAEWAEGEQA